MLKAAKNMRGKLALLYRVTGRPGHSLHIFLNSTYVQICAALHICSVTAGTPIGVAQRFLQKRPYDPDGAPLEQKTLSKRAHVVGRWREIRNC